MLFLVLGAVVLGGVYCCVYIVRVQRKRCLSKAELFGKTAIVTGSNTGIGKATALALAQRGARVIIACGSQQGGEAAANDIRKGSGNDEVVFMPLDLGNLKSIRSFAEAFLKAEPRLDLLINNAVLSSAGRTEDGLGVILGFNHIGPFLLTNLLLERLTECGPSRIVNVSSFLYEHGTIDFNCINSHKRLALGSNDVEIFGVYCHSKLCNVLFTRELTKRLMGTEVTCYSLDPGSAKTELSSEFSSWYMCPFQLTASMFQKDPLAGAQTMLHCALQEGIEHLSGGYFSDCEVREVKGEARDEEVARRLWEVSEKLSGLA